jgi:hypothetical protein
VCEKNGLIKIVFLAESDFACGLFLTKIKEVINEKIGI